MMWLSQNQNLLIKQQLIDLLNPILQSLHLIDDKAN